MDDLYAAEDPIHGPEVPRHFSHSTLVELERCPRRWWLERATYKTGQGYPSIATPAALRGIVIHAAMERFAAHLRAAGFPPLGTNAFDTARASFDVRAVVRAARDEVLSHSARRGPLVSADQVPLDACVAGFKRLQSRAYAVSLDDQTQPAKLVFSSASTTVASASAQLIPVMPEVRIELDDPPLVAVIDQVRTQEDADQLVDFKSGVPKPDHENQLRIYAAMWIKARNRPVSARTVIYVDAPSHEYGPMTRPESAEVLDATARRVAGVRLALDGQPPVARPRNENCAFCPVRQLCPEYWTAQETRDMIWRLEDIGAPERADGWKDLELNMNGATATPNGFSIPLPDKGMLFCTLPASFRPTTMAPFHSIRLLNVALRRHPPSIDIVMSTSSEAFWIEDMARR